MRPTIIKSFPGEAVEAFRKTHGGALPNELKTCPFCGQDDAAYDKDTPLHFVLCQFCGCRTPSTMTQDGCRVIWNSRARGGPEEKR